MGMDPCPHLCGVGVGGSTRLLYLARTPAPTHPRMLDPLMHAGASRCIP